MKNMHKTYDELVVLKSYVAAAWNLDPSRRLHQQGEPTDKDMKKAAKAVQRSTVHSTYMAQSEMIETLTVARRILQNT